MAPPPRGLLFGGGLLILLHQCGVGHKAVDGAHDFVLVVDEHGVRDAPAREEFPVLLKDFGFLVVDIDRDDFDLLL